MSFPVPFIIRQLASDDVPLMEALLTAFGKAFDEVETYSAARPSKAYLERLLGSDYFIAAALKNDLVVGGIAAYELHKFEQERSEIYIYDLAVAQRTGARVRDGVDSGAQEDCCSVRCLCHFRAGGHRRCTCNRTLYEARSSRRSAALRYRSSRW